MSNRSKVPAKNFVQTMTANVNNDKLDDAAFREFVRNTLPIVEGGEALVEDNRKVTHVGDISDLGKPQQRRENRDK